MIPLVLHARASNFFGGPERQIIGHIKASLKSRHVVLTFEEKGKKNSFSERCGLEGIAVERILGNSAYSPLAIYGFRKKVKDLRPDVLCTHGYRPAILWHLAGMGLNVPVVMFARGHTSENRKVSIFEKLERLCMRKADLVVAVSKGYAEGLKKSGIEPSRIRVVRNAAFLWHLAKEERKDKRKLLEELRLPDKAKIIVSAGRLSPEKGHRYLVEAIPKLRDSNHETFVIFCGEGPCRKELEDKARSLAVYEQCRFPGFRQDVKDIFEMMDLMVLPSLTEGLPNVVLEAFACAKPVVATNVGGVPEVVEDGINGYLVPPQRPDLLAEAMKKCLSSPASARKMGEAGCIKVKNEFTFETQTRLLEGIYEEILSGRVKG